MGKGRPNGANEGTGRVAADEADAEARLNRLLADLELLSRAATELSERETRLLNGCRTAWHCLQRAPELSERGRWARDVLVAAMDGRQPRWSGPESPFEAARAYIGEDYPEAGWPDGQPSGQPSGRRP